MASILPRTVSTTRILTGAAVLGITGSALYLNSRRRPLLLDSAHNAPTSLLSIPSTMLFSKQLSVTAVEQVNHDTKRITFSLPGGAGQISGAPPGAAILTQHTPAGAWFPVFRPYTPISPADARGTVQLLVKKYPNGRASGHLHSLTPGQTLTVRGPLPGYAWKPSATPRDLLFVAGGAGITPLYSLAQGILAHPDDRSRVQLVWGVNGTRDFVLKDELDALETRFPDRFKVTYVVSGPEASPDAPSLGDAGKFKKGYVNAEVLKEAIQRCEAGGSWGDEKGTKVFLCGPPKMEEAIAGKKGVLAELGIEAKKVHRF